MCDTNQGEVRPLTNMKKAEGQMRWEAYEAFSRTRLSKHFIMRDFLYNTRATVMGIPNVPENKAMALRAGRYLCKELLEPIHEQFGKLFVTFGYQCGAVYDHLPEKRSFLPHQWDRHTTPQHVIARVDIVPQAVADGVVDKVEFGTWVMWNLDIDLMMHWSKSSVFCITVNEEKQRRVWVEWGKFGKGNRKFHLGEQFWQEEFPVMSHSERPKFYPSCSEGRFTYS